METYLLTGSRPGRRRVDSCQDGNRCGGELHDGGLLWYECSQVGVGPARKPGETRMGQRPFLRMVVIPAVSQSDQLKWRRSGREQGIADPNARYSSPCQVDSEGPFTMQITTRQEQSVAVSKVPGKVG